MELKVKSKIMFKTGLSFEILSQTIYPVARNRIMTDRARRDHFVQIGVSNKASQT